MQARCHLKSRLVQRGTMLLLKSNNNQSPPIENRLFKHTYLSGSKKKKAHILGDEVQVLENKKVY